MSRLTRASQAMRTLRPGRLLLILLVALAAGLLADWLRADRVLLPRPLPAFTTVPAP